MTLTKKETIVRLRRYALNRIFEFTDEQVQKIIKVDQILQVLTKQLYCTNYNIPNTLSNKEIPLIESNGYDFDSIIIMDSSSISKRKALHYLLQWCNITKFEPQPPCAFDYYLSREFNWNIELFSHPNILKFNPRIGYSTHRLFCDGKVLSLFDMIELKKKHFRLQPFIVKKSSILNIL